MRALRIINKARALKKIQEDRQPKTAQLATTAAAPSLERWADDFLGFVSLLDIVPKDTRAGRIKLQPNTIQAAFEGSRTGRDIILKPRQIGFTTWELARDVWYFLTRRGAKVVVVVQSSADHAPLKSLSSKLRVMFESLEAIGIQLNFGTESTSEWSLPARDSSLHIVEAGGSEVSADKKGRGGTVKRLHVTELAFFEFGEATLNALLESVPDQSTGSEVTIESTANGASGEFFDRYSQAKNGKSGYRAHFYRWLDQSEYAAPLDAGEVVSPENERERELVERHGATEQQLKWYRRKLGDKKGNTDLFDQEYPVDEETCWLVAGRLFFDRARTKELLTQTREPIEVRAVGGGGATLRIWKHKLPLTEYVIAADPSEGVGGDAGAAKVYERATGEHVATLHGQFPKWSFGHQLASLGHHYNDATIAVERNNHGHAVLQALLDGEKPYPNVYEAHDGRPGWLTTAITRSAALDALEAAHRDGEWSTPDRMVLSEMLTFVISKDGKPQAGPGAHDDLVMASAIGHAVLSSPTGAVGYDTTYDDDLPQGRW